VAQCSAWPTGIPEADASDMLIFHARTGYGTIAKKQKLQALAAHPICTNQYFHNDKFVE
jgi:hypothetical protein